MTRQSLPIGIQDFATIRSEGFYYVDKTPLIRQLVSAGRHYFLSRPRRFGKSLLVDTLKALFTGQEELFRGLDIHDHWDWSVTHPVVRLSFGRKYDKPEDIERNILAQLTAIERRAGLAASTWSTAPEYLFDVLERLHHTTGQRVVVLVDEYDKPILDALSDFDRAHANRDYLRGIYGIIKGSAAHVRFVFVTGVSMFSKVSLFSDMNNLKDISLDPRFATICGYTDADIDTVFAPELAGLDRDEIRSWYNGYNWRGETRLYNPFDVLLL
ncbi:MAG: AAA family ATPase, partial [Rhodobacteraceae bacterium]|nr:AAA family ATPase [Paracoccaceae bacterium]